MSESGENEVVPGSSGGERKGTKQLRDLSSNKLKSLSSLLGEDKPPDLSVSYGLTNSAVSLLLFGIAVACMYLIFSDEQNTQDIYCDFSSSDARVNLQCGFKFSCFFMSVILLVPYLLEAVLCAELFIGGRAVPEKVYGIIDKTTSSNAMQTLVFGARNLVYLIYAMVASLIFLPFIFCSEQIMSSWKAIPYVVPSLLLNMALFPLAYVVIFSSQTIAETFVNLVAVQIFASLSDVFVAQIFTPEKAIASTLTLYFPSVDFQEDMPEHKV